MIACGQTGETEMERRDNYAIQVENARAGFLTYDQEAMIRRFHLDADGDYLYATLLARRYRIKRSSGFLEAWVNDRWVDGNSHSEVMTLFDILCDAREDRRLSGQWKTMQDFGLMFHTPLLESQRDANAAYFDRNPQVLRRGCQALGGVPFSGGDIGFAVELFDGLSIAVQFWHGDEDFAPRLRYLWDANALQYIRYETMYFAVELLLRRIREAAG